MFQVGQQALFLQNGVISSRSAAKSAVDSSQSFEQWLRRASTHGVECRLRETFHGAQ